MQKWWQTIALLLLCLAGFLPTKGGAVALRQGQNDTLYQPLHYYTEGIKELYITGDSSAAERCFQHALRLDSTYAPAHYKLAEMALSRDNRTALNRARKAYAQDTVNRFYLTVYAHAQVLNQDYKGALSSYRRLTQIERHNPDNYRMTALLEEQTGNRREAIALLDSAQVLFGRNSHLGAIKRRMLMMEGAHDRALKEALEEVEALPHLAESHLALGDIYHHMGNDSLALNAYNRALAVDSSHLETLLTLADFHSRKRNYPPYFELTRLIFEHPNFPLADKISSFHRFTSDIRFYREHYNQLSSLARTLALRYPKEPEVVELYANHLIASGAMEQALELYKLRLGDKPPRLKYFSMVIDLESFLERPDSADHYLKSAIELFPKQTELYLQQGQIASFFSQQYDRAEEAFRKALTLAESDSLRSSIWGYIGDNYQQRCQKGYTSAEAAFEAMADKRADKKMKHWLKACYKAYDEALLLNPNNQSVLNNYAYFLALEGRNLTQALEFSSRLVAITKNNPTYLDTHAWVLFRLGRPEEAKRFLQQAVSLDGRRSAAIQLHYGDVLAALGEDFMAEVYWKRALENGADAAEIERRIENLKQKGEKP